MVQIDRVTRRKTGATKRAQHVGHSEVPLGTEASDLDPSRKSYKRKTFSRRRKVTSNHLMSISIIHRKLILYMRRNPENTYAVAAFGFVAASLLIFFTSTLFQAIFSAKQTISETETQPTNRGKGKRKLSDHVPVLPETRPKASFDIIFKAIGPSLSNYFETEELGEEAWEEGLYMDFGDLELDFFEFDETGRNIIRDMSAMKTDFRPYSQQRDDDIDMYYAFDDDYLRSTYTAVDNKDEYDSEKLCRRTSVHRKNFQTCNSFHETPLIESNAHYLSAGAYRQVLVVDNRIPDRLEKIILKDIHYNYDFNYEHFEYVRVDALVAERLTSSPRIYDIYGSCGLGILSEFFPHGDMESIAVTGSGYIEPHKLHDGYRLKPQNDLTPIEKLEICTQMAEALADLHGNKEGVIVHQDIQLSQFLWTKDKSRVKLNDFNRAEFMLWDAENKEYCHYHEGLGMGSWRSPEEYFDKPVTEQIDIFSLANNFYSILTGLYPFYDLEDDEIRKTKLKDGETAYIDPRWKTKSFEEGKIVEVIEKMYVYTPDSRPGVFEVVSFLKASLKEARAKTSTK